MRESDAKSVTKNKGPLHYILMYISTTDIHI